MSDIKWSTVECKGVSGGGEAGFIAITDGIASAFGLSFEKSETKSNGDICRIYKIRSLTNCYIGFKTSGDYLVSDKCYFKLPNGNFVNFGNIDAVNGAVCRLTDSDGVYCKRAEFCGYNFRAIHPMSGVNAPCYIGFTTGKFTDYFSGKTHDVLIGAGKTGFFNFYIYDEDDNNYTTLRKISVGGNAYPTKKQNIAVATPVMFGNDKYYGYIGNSSSLYELYGDYTKPGPITSIELGMQATINGVSFRLISRTGSYSNIFIRSG